MTRPRTTLGLLALLGLALAPAACKQSDSILLVEVYGPAMLDPVQLSVTMTAGAPPETRNFNVPSMARDTSAPISLPTSFTIALDRSLTGPVIISIEANDANQSPLAVGSTMMTHIEIGGQTDVSVDLMVPLPPGTVDGGTDAGGADAAGQGGAGAGGGDGAAGQSGASGSDGGVDGADAALGLDGATD